MFGAFQFQYTMDFFKFKTFGKSGMSHRLMRRFLLTACFKKEVVLTMVLSLYYAFDRGAIYMNNRENRFPVSVCIDRSMILQTLDSRTGNEVNYYKYRLILSFRMR